MTIIMVMGVRLRLVGVEILDGAKNYAARYLIEQLKSAVGLV
jgi:hypothetical protein